MKKVRITESQLKGLVKRMVREEKGLVKEMIFEPKDYPKPNRRERDKIKAFMSDITTALQRGGTDWDTNVPNPSLNMLIDKVRSICDSYENI